MFKKIGKLYKKIFYCSRDVHWTKISDITRDTNCVICGKFIKGLDWNYYIKEK